MNVFKTALELNWLQKIWRNVRPEYIFICVLFGASIFVGLLAASSREREMAERIMNYPLCDDVYDVPTILNGVKVRHIPSGDIVRVLEDLSIWTQPCRTSGTGKMVRRYYFFRRFEVQFSDGAVIEVYRDTLEALSTHSQINQLNCVQGSLDGK